MTDPIVSPWLIYLLGQINTIGDGLVIMAVLSTICAFIIIVIGGAAVADKIVKVKTYKIASYITGPITVVLILMAMLCPDRDTVIAMCVANEVTPQAISKTVEGAKGLHEGLGVMKDELVTDIIKILNHKEKPSDG